MLAQSDSDLCSDHHLQALDRRCLRVNAIELQDTRDVLPMPCHYLDAFLVDHAAVHFQDGAFDGPRCGQHLEADVDRVRTLGVEHGDFFFHVATFLESERRG